MRMWKVLQWDPADTGRFPYIQIGDYIVITNSGRPPLKFAILNGLSATQLNLLNHILYEVVLFICFSI